MTNTALPGTPYRHTVEPWTVARLRAALARVPGHLVVVIEAADEAGGEYMNEQVLVEVAVGDPLEGLTPTEPGRHVRQFDPSRGRSAFRLATEFPSGDYPAPEHPRAGP